MRENRFVRIAEANPREEFREDGSALLHDGAAGNRVKGVAEVDFEQNEIRVNGVGIDNFTRAVNNEFQTPRTRYSQLRGTEVLGCSLLGEGANALGNEAAQCFPDADRPHIPRGRVVGLVLSLAKLEQGREASSREEFGHRRWEVRPGKHRVDKVPERGRKRKLQRSVAELEEVVCSQA